MSMEIDERVVEMRFDNSNFEKNVSTSLGTIDKLKRALKFDKSSQGLEILGQTASKISLNPLVNGANAAAKGFSVLEGAAAVALGNIETKAIMVGIQMLKNLSVDNVMLGWDKYGQKTEGVQTIMAATGKSIEEVNKYLEKLIWYSDETSYSFTDMVTNIGKFTSAGVDLETSVDAMMGISNWAAVSGQNAQTATRAYYNLAQALSVGAVKMTDWKSIQNANMSTVEFKNTVIDTALSLGVLKKGSDDVARTMKGTAVTAQSFEQALSEGWFNSEVLIKSLSKYSNYTNAIYDVSDAFDTCAEAMANVSSEGMELSAKAFKTAQEAKTFVEVIDATKDAVSSGWMETFELIFGNYTQATKLWTNLANVMWDVFASGADARNDLLRSALHGSELIDSDTFDRIHEATGSSKALIKVLKEVGKEAGVNFKQLKKEGKSFSDSLESEWLDMDKFVKSLQRFSKDSTVDLLKLSDAEIEALGYTRKEVKELRKLINTANEAGTPLREILESMIRPKGYDLFVEGFNNSLNALVNTINAVKEAWREVFPATTSKRLYDLIKRFNEFSKRALEASEGLDKFKNILKGVFSILDMIATTVRGIVDAVFIAFGGTVKSLAKSFLNLFSTMGLVLQQYNKTYKASRTLIDVLKEFAQKVDNFQKKAFIIGYLLTAIVKEYLRTSALGEQLRKLGENLVTAFKVVLYVLLNIVEKLGSAFINFIKIISGGAIKNASGILTFLVERLNYFLEKIINFNGISFNKITGEFKKLKTAAANILVNPIEGVKEFATAARSGIGGAVSFILEKLSDLRDFIVGTFEAIRALNLPWGTILAVGTLLYSLRTINRVVKVIENFKNKFGVLTALNKMLGNIGKSFKAKAFKEYAIGIGILAASLATLTLVDPTNLKTAAVCLAGITGALAGLTVLVGLLANRLEGLKMLQISGLVLAFSASLFILAKTLESIGNINANGIGKKILALAGMAAGLLVVASIIKSITFGLPSTSDMSKALTVISTLVGFSLSLFLFIKALDWLTKVDFTSIKHNVGGMSTILISFGLLLVACGKSGGFAASAGSGLLKMTLAMYLMTKVIKSIVKIPKTDLKTGGAVIAGLSAIFAVLSALFIRGNGKHADRLGSYILKMSASMYLLVGLLKIVSLIDDAPLWKAIGAVAALSTCMSIVVASASISGKAHKAIGKMSAVVGVMAIALAALSLIDADRLNSTSWAMVKALSAVAVVFWSLSKIKIDKKQSSAIVAIISMTGLIGLMLGGIALISNNKANADSLYGIASIFLGYGALLAVISKTLDNVDREKFRDAMTDAGWVLAGVTALVAVLSHLLNKDVSASSMIATLSGISAVIVSVGAMLKLMDGVRINKTAKESSSFIYEMLAAVTVIAGALAMVMSILAPTSSGIAGMSAAMSGIALILLSIGEMLQLLDGVKISTTVTKSLGEMLKVIVVLGVVITAMSGLLSSNASIPTMVTAMTGIAGLLIAMAYALKIVDGIKIDDAVTEAMLGLSFVAGILAVVLGGMSKALGTADIPTLIGSAVALGTLMTILSMDLAILSGIASSIDLKSMAIAEGALAGLSIVSAIAAGVLTIMSGGNGPAMLAAAASLGILLTALSVDLLILSAVGPVAGMALNGALALAGFVGIFTVAGLLGGALSAITNDGKLILDGIELLAKIAEGIGNIVGGIIGGVLGGIGKGLTDGFVDFIETSVSAFERLKVVDPSVGAGLRNLVESYTILLSSGFTNALTGGAIRVEAMNQFAEGLEGLIKALARMMYALRDYGVSESDCDVAEVVSRILLSLVNAANQIPNSGGVAGFFAGDNDLNAFGSMMASFATSLLSFLNIVKGMSLTEADVSQVDLVGKILVSMTSAADQIPNSGGMAGFFAGDNDLNAFGSMMAMFAPSLASFVSVVRGMKLSDSDVTQVDLAGQATVIMARIAEDLPNSGGMVSWFTGDNKLSDFGQEMENFIPHLRKFINKARKLGDNPVGVARNAANATVAIAEIIDTLPENGLFNDKAQKLPDFGEKLEAFAPHIVAFASAVAGITDTEQMKAVAQAIKEMAENLNVAYFNNSVLTGKKKVTKLISENLSNIGTGITNFYGNISGVNSSVFKDYAIGLQELVTACNDMKFISEEHITKFGEIMGNMGDLGIDTFIEKMSGTAPLTHVKNAVWAIITTVSDYIAEQQDKFKLDGASIVDAIVDGMTGRLEELKGAISDTMSEIDSIIKVELHVDSTNTSGGESTVAPPPAEVANNSVEQAIESTASNTAAAEKAGEALGEATTTAYQNTVTSEMSANGSVQNAVNNTVTSAPTTGYETAGATAANAYVQKFSDIATEKVGGVLNFLQSKAAQYGIDVDAIYNSIDGHGLLSGVMTSLTGIPTEAREAAAEERKLSAVNEELDKIIEGLTDDLSGNDSLSSALGDYTSAASGASGASKSLSEGMKNLPKNMELAKKSIVTVLNEKNQNKSAEKIYKKIGEDAVKGIFHGYNETLAKTSVSLEKFNKKIEKEYNSSISVSKKNGSAVNAAAKSLYIGGDLFKSAANTYAEGMRSLGDTTPLTKLRNATRKVVTQIYMESDAYKASAKSLKTYEKSLRNYENKRNKLVKKLENENLSEKDKQKYADELDKVTKNITQTQKNINKTQKKMGKEAKDAYKGYRKNLKEHIKSQLDLLSIGVKQAVDIVSTIPERIDLATASLTGIDLFAGVTDSAKSLLSTLKEIDLFSKFELDYSVSSLSLMETSNSQIEGYKKLEEDLNALAELQINPDLYKELEDMGLSGLSNIEAILKMTDEELQQFNANYEAKQSIMVDQLISDIAKTYSASANREANLTKLVAMGFGEEVVDELKNMGDEADKYITAFVNASSDQMDELKELFAQKATNAIPQFLRSMSDEADKVKNYNDDIADLATKGFDEGLQNEIEALGIAGADKVKTLLKMTEEEIAQANETFRRKQKLLAEEVVRDMDNTIVKSKNRGKYAEELIAAGFDSDYIHKLVEDQNDDVLDALYGSIDDEDIRKGINLNQKRIIDLQAKDAQKSAQEALDKYAKWLDDMETLSSDYHLDSDILKQLKEQGIESYDTVQMYLAMGKAGIKKLNDLQKQSRALSAKEMASDWDDFYQKAQTYNENLADLGKMGLDEDFYKEIVSKGIDAYDMIQAMLDDPESAEAMNKTYKEMLDISPEIANTAMTSWVGVTANIGAESGKEMAKAFNENIDLSQALSLDEKDEETLNEKMTNSAKKASDTYTTSFKDEQKANKNTITKSLKLTQTQISKISATFTAGGTQARQAFIDAIKPVTSKLNNLFYDAGWNSAWGYTEGLEAGIVDVQESARALAKAALKYTNQTLDIHSPSREFWKSGKFSALGLANGVTDNLFYVTDACAEAGETMLETLEDTISNIVNYLIDDEDITPTITPVVDMSSVRDSLTSINSMFSKEETMRVDASMRSAKAQATQTSNNVAGVAAANNSYNFVQNNYSPKSLSRTDIYRQTKNQFAMFKGALV